MHYDPHPTQTRMHTHAHHEHMNSCRCNMQVTVKQDQLSWHEYHCLNIHRVINTPAMGTAPLPLHVSVISCIGECVASYEGAGVSMCYCRQGHGNIRTVNVPSLTSIL